MQQLFLFFCSSLSNGTLVPTTQLQVVYFRMSRDLILNDTKRQQQDGMERLQEAKEFAEWSKNDRERRMQTLTPEQKDQMKNYLKLVQEHGFSQMQHGQECTDAEGDPRRCPVLNQAKELLGIDTSFEKHAR